MLSLPMTQYLAAFLNFMCSKKHFCPSKQVIVVSCDFTFSIPLSPNLEFIVGRLDKKVTKGWKRPRFLNMSNEHFTRLTLRQMTPTTPCLSCWGGRPAFTHFFLLNDGGLCACGSWAPPCGSSKHVCFFPFPTQADMHEYWHMHLYVLEDVSGCTHLWPAGIMRLQRVRAPLSALIPLSAWLYSNGWVCACMSEWKWGCAHMSSGCNTQ